MVEAVSVEDAYRRKLCDVRSRMRSIENALTRHAERRKTGDWGYVGDLSYVHDKLGEVLRFLGDYDG